MMITATRMDTPPPPAASRRIKLRIALETGAISSSNHDPLRGADAESWATLFEQEQGRFPDPLPHLQGEDAFGCDILSFASAADRDAFRLTMDERLVARFVEVKSGGVRLTSNQIKSARRNRHRYHIYRIRVPRS